MTSHGTKEYRRDMASIHEHVATTGEEVVVTRAGRPYVKVVPATEQSLLERLHAEGKVRLPTGPRRAVTPVDAGGEDSTDVIATMRR